jgi:hypothetical protein
MKTRTKLVSFLFATIAVTTMAGCGIFSGGGSSPFFTVVTVYQLNGFTKLDPHVNVAGFANAPQFNCPAGGNTTSFGPVSTDSNAQYKVANAVLGGTACSWTINRGTSVNCPSPNPSGTTAFVNFNGVTVNVPCNGSTIFNAGPSLIDSNNPPSTITITGQNMSAANGMPQVTIYDVNQNALLTVTATSASGDGTSITIPADQIAYLGDGNYGAVVYVKQSNGTWDTVGGAGIDLWTSGGGGNPCNPPMPCC